MAGFKFELNLPVQIFASGETGVVIGRAEYASFGDNYLVRYVNANGIAVEQWWAEDALVRADQD